MDLVAAAQLTSPVVCTDASLLSNCSAHVTEMLLCCSVFASFDQKSPVSSSHFYSSISWIVLQKGCITTRRKCGLTLPAGSLVALVSWVVEGGTRLAVMYAHQGVFAGVNWVICVHV